MTTDARRTATDARSTVDGRLAGSWGAWPPPTPGDRPLSMTSRADGIEHAVMATELEQANRTGQSPMGLCGVAVDPAPLGATGRHACRPCRDAVARRGAAHPSPSAWTLLVQWYEALVALLRRGVPVPAPKAIAPPRPVLALPPSPAPVARPTPSPRPRTSPPLRSPHPVREPGGRHRRAD